MFRPHTYILSVPAVLIAVLLISCGDSGSLGTPAGTTVLTVNVKDTTGAPVDGILVETSPKTIIRLTDEEGSAVFDDIATGTYQITAKRNDVNIFSQTVVLANKPVIINFTIAVEVTVNLSLRHAQGIPLDGVTVETSPPTSVITIGADSVVVLKNVPVKPYTFIITRGPAIAYIPNKVISIVNGEVQDLDLVIEPQSPQVAITNIGNNYYHSIFGMTFEASGTDFEDGILPSGAFSWYSDIDGYLGTGANIAVDRMSIGHHLITLVGEDADQLKDTETRTIVLSFDSPDSYFPIPRDARWTYTNSPAYVSVKNEGGEVELFQFMDIETVMADVNERISTMMYYNGGGDWYRYTVTDYFDNDDDAFFVTSTVEKIDAWIVEPEGNEPPNNTVTITTVYGDKYPLFGSHLDLSTGAEIDYTAEADVTWLFTGIAYGSQRFIERITVTSQTSFAGYETIQTPAGSFETAKLHIIQGDTERYWWLARGYGIVQYSYNSFGTPVIASLVDTTIGEPPGAARPKVSQWEDAATLSPAKQPVITSSGSIPGDFRELVERFRGMAPR